MLLRRIKDTGYCTINRLIGSARRPLKRPEACRNLARGVDNCRCRGACQSRINWRLSGGNSSVLASSPISRDSAGRSHAKGDLFAGAGLSDGCICQASLSRRAVSGPRYEWSSREEVVPRYLCRRPDRS
ncbi:hypothetical protein AVEN_96095-1 [Araneus ventricosus]|uniref:Uncharacterized protein n=1 Tax=Araneus ventricosus TaxID=182803 RepID=A0A4Y2B738_ARAVE|nr:hypothetical protein AVEN_96095-1 [Araneus ventricosus]